MIRIRAKGRNNGSVVRMTDITLTEDLDAIPSTSSYAPKTRIFFLWFSWDTRKWSRRTSLGSSKREGWGQKLWLLWPQGQRDGSASKGACHQARWWKERTRTQRCVWPHTYCATNMPHPHTNFFKKNAPRPGTWFYIALKLLPYPHFKQVRLNKMKGKLESFCSRVIYPYLKTESFLHVTTTYKKLKD